MAGNFRVILKQVGIEHNIENIQTHVLNSLISLIGKIQQFPPQA